MPVNKLPTRIYHDYAHSLKTLLDRVTSILADTPDPTAAARRVANLASDPDLIAFCDARALRMVTQVRTQVDGSWRIAARKASRGDAIRRAILRELTDTRVGGTLFAAVRVNAELIRTFPLDLARGITRFIAEETLTGRRASDIAEKLRRDYPDITQNRLNLIARIEVMACDTQPFIALIG